MWNWCNILYVYNTSATKADLLPFPSTSTMYCICTSGNMYENNTGQDSQLQTIMHFAHDARCSGQAGWKNDLNDCTMLGWKYSEYSRQSYLRTLNRGKGKHTAYVVHTLT
jgi:hypothetical protein